MPGFIDVILRGLALVCASLALGGMAWTRFVLRAEPYAKPDAAARIALRAVALGAAGVAATQVARMALTAVAVLVAAGVGLTLAYVGDLAAFVGTAYGVMIVSKVVLFVAALAFASANFRMARAAAGPSGRLGRYVEIELGLAITVL